MEGLIKTLHNYIERGITMPDTLQKRILEQEQMTDYIRELKTGDRILSIMGDEGKNRVVVFKKPTRQNEMDARVFYASLYNNLLESGVPTRAEARKKFLLKLAETGVDTDTYEQKRDEIHTKIAQQLQENMDEAQAKDVLTSMPSMLRVLDQSLKTMSKDEMTMLRTMADVEAMEQQMLSNCAEVIAESEAALYAISQIAHNPDGSFVWPTVDDMNNETDASFILRLREEYTRWKQGFPLLFEVITPTREEVPNASPSL